MLASDWAQKTITDKHSNESWNRFVKSSIPGAASPVLKRNSRPFLLTRLTTPGHPGVIKIMIFLTNYKIIYIFRSSTDRLRVFTIWWSTGISEEEQRPFRQLQHRREKTRIQTHSQGSLIFRMDDSWWNALFGHNEGNSLQSPLLNTQ